MAQSAPPARNDFTNRASADVSKAASDIAASAGHGIDRAMEGAQAAARQVADAGVDAQKSMQEVAGNVGRAVEKSVKEQPTATLLMAAALGFVIGALWKS